jgi:glutamate racemase
VACNTATVIAIRHLREQTHIPVVAIEPAIKPAVNTSRTGVVGVLATTQTLQSESVARLCQEHGEGKRILLQACPGWVEAVDQADLHSPQTEALLRQFVVPLMDQGVDTLVLGCTHYPFLRDTLQRIVGDSVVLIDPAVAVAAELTRRLGLNRRVDAERVGATRFFTTGDVSHVQQVVAHLWGDGAVVEAMGK